MRSEVAGRAHIGLGAALAFGGAFGVAVAQEGGEPASRGQMTFTYQYQEAQDLVSEFYVIASAPITTHLVDFAVSYRLKERWTLTAGLPLISRRWEGGPSHNPLRIDPPQLDSEFVDDGHFNTFWQDLRLGASYAVVDDYSLTVEPYVEYGIPASDYPFFAASAVGRNVLTLEAGTMVAYRPPFLPWNFSLRAGYTMTDSVLGIDTDAMRVTLDAARFINERLTVNAFLMSKNGTGIQPEQTPDFTSELWYQHDRIIRHNFMNLGLGVNWTLNERNVLSFALLRMVHVEDVFKLRDAVSVTLSRPF